MDKETIEIGMNDAAIIIKQDMSTEIIIPKMEDEDNITFEENQNVFITLAISAAMSDDNFRALISAKLDEMFTKVEEDGSCDTDSPDSPDSPDCGGCQGCG